MARKMKFTKDYDHRVEGGHAISDVAYRRGTVDLIPDSHAEAAVEAGAAEDHVEEAQVEEEQPSRAKRR